MMFEKNSKVDGNLCARSVNYQAQFKVIKLNFQMPTWFRFQLSSTLS